jgi:predicted nucleotidyltransferase
VIKEIQNLRSQIDALCHRHHVRRLELFGSAAAGTVKPDSDVDLLVEFAPMAGGDYAEHFFGFKEELEALLRRPVDLVVLRAVRNPFFLEGISASRELLYAA